jgi:predicted GNAT family acetyltransferase
MTTATDVVDEPERHRFRYSEDGADAELVYRVDGDRLVLVHTEVPKALGGRGVGGRLVRAAVERAERSGETVLPWCPFARTWLRDHPDVAAGISIDWSDPPG